MESFTRNGTKYIIRLLEKRDEEAATKIIWEMIYLRTTVKIIKSNLIAKRFICLCVFLGYLGFVQSNHSFVTGILWLLFPPCFVYGLGRFVLLPLEFKYSPGLLPGELYTYWSQTELGRRFWVVEVDGAIVATAAVDRNSVTAAQVFRVGVETKCRGQGLASKLMDTVLKYCKKVGVDHVVLLTSDAQIEAISLYEKIGFERVSNGIYGPIPYFLTFQKFLYHLSPTGASPGIYAGPKGLSYIPH